MLCLSPSKGDSTKRDVCISVVLCVYGTINSQQKAHNLRLLKAHPSLPLPEGFCKGTVGELHNLFCTSILVRQLAYKVTSCNSTNDLRGVTKPGAGFEYTYTERGRWSKVMVVVDDWIRHKKHLNYKSEVGIYKLRKRRKTKLRTVMQRKYKE